MSTIPPALLAELLNVELPANTKRFFALRTDEEAPVITVRDYLRVTFTKFVECPECFNGKRPFGTSDWEDPIVRAWITSCHIKGTLDEDGFVESMDSVGYHERIDSVIAAIFAI